MARPLSPSVSAGGLIYLSGALALDAGGAIVGKGDVAAQTTRVMERLRIVLDAAGSSFDDVLSATVYLTSASFFQTMNGAYRPFWPKDPPARTTVITNLVLPDALVEISLIAAPKGAERRVIHPEGWLRSPNPYSYAIQSGETVFLSGLVPRRGRDNSLVSGDITAQTRAVMDNGNELLAAAGLSFDNVVTTRVYLTDAANFKGMNEAYREYFGGAPPARATVTCGLAGPDVLVEMTFTASTSPRQAIGSPPPGIPISPAVRAGQRVYLSGALGNTPETAGNVEAQTRETLVRLGRTLETAGVTPADVVDSTVYLKDVSSFGVMNGPYAAFFNGRYPARTTIGTPLVVDDGLVEIMMTAVV
jgi:2-iminobutanoate/2-iminopropanoate deaminase